MIRTRIIPCDLPRQVCDALNAASGSIYTGVLVWHWRTYRRQGVWLSQRAAYRWADRRRTAPMHAHSIDAAQQGFYRACTVARAARKAGCADVRLPYHRRRFRTTI
jgi:putative transposase